MTRSLLPLALLLPLAGAILSGCVAGTKYPGLVPIGEILQNGPVSPDPAPDMQARATALNARADALRRAAP